MSEGHDDRRDRPETPVYEEFDFPREPEVELESGAAAATLRGVALPLEPTPASERRPGGGAAADEQRQACERLWAASLQSPWTSLALVPAVPGVCVRAVAEALVRVGSEYRGRPVELIDAQGLRMSQARELTERVRAVRERHALVVTLDCPLASQSALIAARAASAALLVVPVGPTPLGEARRTLETVGRPLFIGAVTLRSGPA